MKMKKLHHILSVIAVALLLPSTALAQDARQRTPVTIVADVLAEIPYGQRADFDTAMSDLLGTGTYGVTQLASQLVPAGQGENNRVEYALDGLTAYASSHATPSQLAAVREGLVTAINNCHDTPNKAFLMSLLSRVSRPEDAQFFANFLTDSTLTEAAQSALILTPGTDEFVAALVEQGEQYSYRRPERFGQTEHYTEYLQSCQMDSRNTQSLYTDRYPEKREQHSRGNSRQGWFPQD